MESAAGGVEERVREWGREIGFDALAIAGTELGAEEARLLEWLDRERVTRRVGETRIVL